MQKIIYRHQQNDWYCGPACLQMVLSYFGIRKSQDALARMAKTSKRSGTTRKNLLLAVRRFGLAAFQKEKMTLWDLRHIIADHMIMINYPELSEDIDHYAVVDRLTAKSIRFFDPWNGEKYAIPLGTFARRWRSKSYRKKYPAWALLIPKIQSKES